MSHLQQPSVSREVTRYMEPGHWFISLYNDDGDEQEITFYAAVADDMTQNCPSGCSGNGQCLLGHCQCNPGFGGDDCSESKWFSIRSYCEPCEGVWDNGGREVKERVKRVELAPLFSQTLHFSYKCVLRWEKLPPKRFDECSWSESESSRPFKGGCSLHLDIVWKSSMCMWHPMSINGKCSMNRE